MRHVPLVRIAAIALLGLLLGQAGASAWVHAHGALPARGETVLAEGAPDDDGSGSAHDPLACKACRLRAEGDRPVLGAPVPEAPDAAASSRLASDGSVAALAWLRCGARSARAPPVRS